MCTEDNVKIVTLKSINERGEKQASVSINKKQSRRYLPTLEEVLLIKNKVILHFRLRQT